MITQFFEAGGNILNQPKEKSPTSSLLPETHNNSNVVIPKGQFFVIQIKGQLSSIWADWFDGLTIEYLENGEMRLIGNIVDQSALMGILNKLVRLNLTLVSINEIKEPGENK
jgi:hypothetical protein